MEAEVHKLKLMFQKKNPVTVLKELSAMKSHYQSLYARFKPVAVEQKETKSRIYATLNKTMTMIQELQKQTDLELSPDSSAVTEEEKTVRHNRLMKKWTCKRKLRKRSIPEKFRKMSC
uniref:Protein FAM33A n=1 Tax=Spermophilus dauricus TaxID=99837 RepID=A0A8C9QJM7_SPEDA